MMHDIGGYVLAGGRSRRMGRDKSLMEFGGTSLVERVVRTLRTLCADVAIAGGGPELSAYAPVVPDLHPGCGPMAGIEAALAHTCHDWNLFLPVDMPRMTAAVLEERFISIARLSRPQLVAVVHNIDGRDQPTCAMYHRELLPYFQAALQAGEFKLMPVVRNAARAMAAQRRLQEGDLLRNDAIVGADASSFANINTPEEWRRITEQAEASKD